MTMPALPSPGQSWSDDAVTAPAGGYGVFVEAAPGVFEIRARGVAGARAVAAVDGEGLLAASFFAAPLFGASYFVRAGGAASDAYELRRVGSLPDGAALGRLVLVGAAAALFPSTS